MNRMLVSLLKDRVQLERQIQDILIADENGKRIGPDIGMTDNEIKQYSFLRAVDAFSSGNWSYVGLEREASEATEKLVGRPPKGFYLPPEIKRRAMLSSDELDFTRELSTSSGAGGLGLNVIGESFIELLRNNLVCRAAGATFLSNLSNLKGDVLIPKQSSGTTAHWISEGSSVQASSPVLEQLRLSPRTVGGYTEISRKLLLQSSIDVENFVMEDLAKIIALAIDKAAIYGDGDLEPLGILNCQGVGELLYEDSPTFRDVVALEMSLSSANVYGIPSSRFSYVVSPAVMGKLKCTPKAPGQAIFISENERLNGHNMLVTNQLAEDELLFGRWDDLIIGEWTATDILVDKYTHASSGSVRIIALQDVDIAVRYPQSFAVSRVHEE